MVGLAGCAGGENGGNGIELEITVNNPSFDPFRYEYAQMVADSWEELGFAVEVNSMDWNAVVEEALIAQEYDTSVITWDGSPERIDPHTFLYDLFHSSNSVEGGRNEVNYDNPDYDDLAEEQARIFDDDERQEVVYECQKVLAEEQPRTPVANRTQIMPYNNERFSDPEVLIGESLLSFWNMIGVEPADGVEDLRFGYPEEVGSLNPLDYVGAHDRTAIRLIYDRLARIDQDGLPAPWAAEEIDILDEDGEVAVTIREGMTWHDGEDVTVEDVQFSFEFANEHSPIGSDWTDIIDEIEIVDDRELVFHLEEPFAPFVSNTLTQVNLIPMHVWEDVPDEIDEEPVDWDEPDHIGSGPFQLDYWELEEEMVMTAFDDHFEPPNVERLIKVPGSDMSSLVGFLEEEQIDMIGQTPEPNTIDRLEDEEFISFAEVDDHGFHHVNYQMEREPFDDVAVRRALARAIPKADIVDALLDGRGTVADSVIAEVNEFWHNPDVERLEYDLDAARAELEEAGYTWNGDGQIQYPE
ncbi:ABC transporter substrate-binding protein [Natrarchaeobius oligotrophus]|nr:ABC transporter substrate-binding protein [Natrarchaeobius chitinivorans]